ncbi:MAG: hypothetical protein A2W26_07860 [Acidobacteria bacterium RBG_16_64_8]|nr:MAG: hypothetical protein A2W26_07860 [Acidobacteria bacterium RBG_16_64_8]
MWAWKKNMRRESGEIYMERWHLLKTRWLSVYVNKICQPDSDPWFHTHPWQKSWSVKLWNEYIEIVQYVIQVSAIMCLLYNQQRVPGRFSRIPERHRIVELKDGKPVWTLFIGWSSDRPWGFIDPETQNVVDWKTRVQQRGMTPEESRKL